MDPPAAAVVSDAADAAATAATAETVTEDPGGLMAAVYVFFLGSPVNALLTTVCAWLLYRLLRGDSRQASEPVDDFVNPEPLKKHNMTLDELKKYDGKGLDGRVCIGILGKVYDCTRGRKFYGPNGPYSTFAGRDATRALATFDVHAVKDDYDDHTDLTASQKSSVEEWQIQLSERYDYVGLLVRPGEEDKDDVVATPAAAAATTDASDDQKDEDQKKE